MTSRAHALMSTLCRGWKAVAATCAVSLSLAVAEPAAAAIEGSCLGHFGSRGQIGRLLPTGQIERSDRVAVIVNGAEVRAEPDAASRVVATMEFGERVYLEWLDGNYLRINRTSIRNPQPAIGWIHADELLCRTTPLQTDDGLSRKFYIRTIANFAQDQASAVVPLAGPRTPDCARFNNQCQALTRFSLFFIFAQDSQTGRVLLMGQQVSDTDTPLIGWVDIDDGFQWNTRYGLRPTDNLEYDPRTGSLLAGPEVRACLHETLEEAATATDERCNYPILGGPRWFTSSIRIPILERVERQGQTFLRVAMPIANVGEDADAELFNRLDGLDEAISALQGLRNLDVFFLIDGTQSMDPHIDALVGRGASIGVVPAVQNAFATDPRFHNVNVRYGYRVYRDVYAGGEFGMGEAMRLSNNCNPTAAELAQNARELQDQIALIDANYTGNTGIRDTDHEENMVLGLAYAIDDMQACPDHVKLLFVIGDTGFDSARLQADGVPITTEAEIVRLFSDRLRRENTEPIIPFFIQVPRASHLLRSTSYSNAYDLMTRQALSMIDALQIAYTSGLRQSVNRDITENFYSLEGQEIAASQSDMVNYILDRVANYGDQRPINEIIAGLQTGEALVQIINALREDASGIPALRLAQIERRVCETLGAGCTERIVSDVAEGYIMLSDMIVMDVLLSAQEFDGWRDHLRVMRDFSRLNEIELSRLIVNMMLTGVGSTIGELPPEQLNMSVADFLALRRSLPVSQNTPLLSYSLNDFVAKIEGDRAIFTGAEVDTCELLYVARWLERHNLVFDALWRNEFPVVDFEDITDCAIRGSMQNLRFYAEARFPEEQMRFSFVRMTTLGYWIPERFLP
jgi:hypothetical protein